MQFTSRQNSFSTVEHGTFCTNKITLFDGSPYDNNSNSLKVLSRVHTNVKVSYTQAVWVVSYISIDTWPTKMEHEVKSTSIIGHTCGFRLKKGGKYRAQRTVEMRWLQRVDLDGMDTLNVKTMPTQSCCMKMNVDATTDGTLHENTVRWNHCQGCSTKYQPVLRRCTGSEQ